ncbi:MAG: alcohol dehydrogenase catalytic domain-containing protein [Actinomycetota bacterium]
MRAVVFEGDGRVGVHDVAEPAIEDARDAIVLVRVAAICGSDLHFLHGKAPLEPGDVIGHEAVGVIEEVGGAVARFRPGDRVVTAFHIVCGACWFCRNGQTQLCDEWRMLGAGLFGGDLPGAQAELVRVPIADVNLLPVPDGVDDERAVFVGDVLTTAWYGASISEIRAGDAVAVVGAGPVGFLVAQAALGLGAGKVLSLDRLADRLALVEEAGATPIDVTARNAKTAVDEATGGRGADVAIDAVGHPDAFLSALDVVRRGGRVTVVGVYTGERVDMQLGVWWARALDIRLGGICPVHAWWDGALDELRAGRLDPTPLVSHRLPLEDAADGFALFDARRATKVLLRP